MKPLASRVSGIKPSETLQISSKSKEMKAAGIDVIDLAVGEPDFDTPQNIKDAAINAIKQGFTKYTDVAGIKELRQAIANKLKKDNHLDYSADQILVSCGAKDSLYNTVQAVTNPGDEIIIFSPYWTTYKGQVKLAQGKPVIIKGPSTENMSENITSSTKAVILNSPNNPTGDVIDEKELKEIAKVAVENQLYIISDEIYEKFIYDDEHVSMASLNKETKELTIVINGFSKTYAMTGWRVGYSAGPDEIIKAATNIQNHTTSNINSITQKAAIEALNGSQESVEIMKNEFKKRRGFIVKRLNEVGIKLEKPKGAFYVFPDISGFFNDKIKNSADFCKALLEKYRVAAVPGSAFGDDDKIRISYAASNENLKKGMDYLEKFIKSN